MGKQEKKRGNITTHHHHFRTVDLLQLQLHPGVFPSMTLALNNL